MRDRKTRVRHAAMVMGGLALGLLVALLLVANRKSPGHDEEARQAPTAAFIEVQALPFRLAARGQGVARPAKVWQAVANVGGRVVERHPALESGRLLPAGTPLLALDPSRYRLAVAEAEAELASLAAEREQLETEEENTRRLLGLERERLTMAENELSRIERLAGNGSVSQSALDEQRRSTLAQRQAVASLENTLALLPSRRRHLEAQVERATARRAQARRDLEDTRFSAPYDLRVGEVEVEIHQFVAAGQRLFQAHGIAAAEVEAQVPLPMLRRLLGSVSSGGNGEPALDIAGRLDFDRLHAEVELVGGDGVRWPARLTRVASGLDPATRTARVVVTVDEPYRDIDPIARPALQQEMYVRVRLWADSPEPLLAVPAWAVHRGEEVHLIDADGQLQRRTVRVAFEQHDLAVIDAGLAPGERLIVDDLLPAVEGMAVQGRRDEPLERRLRAMARGQTP